MHGSNPFLVLYTHELLSTLHITHQSAYFKYSFHKLKFEFERISRIQQLLQMLSSQQNLVFYSIWFQFEFTIKFEYQTKFSCGFTIQYIST